MLIKKNLKLKVSFGVKIILKESAYIYIRQLNNKSYGKKRYDVNKRES